MNSIGNDIVDLHFIDKARTCTYQFYSKILSVTEQEQYQACYNDNMPFEIYVWLLWSAKESVYKLLKRHEPDLIFSPAKVQLLFESGFTEFQNQQNECKEKKFLKFHNLINSSLEFIFQGRGYYTSSIITPNYIATVANDTPDFSAIDFDVVNIGSSEYKDQSAEVRKYFLEKLKKLYPDKSFEITKSDGGYPVILSDGADTGILVSFAHHSHHVAYAMKRP